MFPGFGLLPYPVRYFCQSSSTKIENSFNVFIFSIVQRFIVMILRQITTAISVSCLFCLQFAFAPVQNSKNTRQITTAQILSHTYLIALDQVIIKDVGRK